MNNDEAAGLTQIVASRIRGYSFRYTDEDALQRGIAEVLKGLDFIREFRIDADNRIDFAVNLATGKIGIEVKIAGSAPDVGKQLRRYLKTPQIDGLVLVTTRRRHRELEREEFEKPIEIVWLGYSGF